jgi:dihydrofolate synthase/folylpolyglutamate synthase
MQFNTLREWLDWQESFHPLSIDMGLDRSQRVFHALNPSGLKPLTITVAGTNGKGSCVAYLEAIYRAQGYRVGAYTSPHILRYNERIKVNGEPVSDECICQAFARIEALRGDTSLSYFEFGTLAALDIFAHSELDIQLLEVGLGGRLDAVNIVDPDVALIAAIGIDHVEWLGHTREAIGKEKAGIFRALKPAIVGDPQPPESLLQCAADKQARLLRIGKEFGYSKLPNGWSWHCGARRIDQLPEPGLKGEHQYRNAASAIVAITEMQDRLPVSEANIRKGLQSACLSGRFQLIEGDIPMLLDVGHNPQAVGTLVDYLKHHFAGQRIHAVFSMMRDKDIAGVLEIMKPIIHDWYFAPLTNFRAASESMMREVFANRGVANANFGFSGFLDAFAAAKSQSQKGDLLLVFGSFFLVSDCLLELERGELTK